MQRMERAVTVSTVPHLKLWQMAPKRKVRTRMEVAWLKHEKAKARPLRTLRLRTRKKLRRRSCSWLTGRRLRWCLTQRRSCAGSRGPADGSVKASLPASKASGVLKTRTPIRRARCTNSPTRSFPSCRSRTRQSGKSKGGRIRKGSRSLASNPRRRRRRRRRAASRLHRWSLQSRSCHLSHRIRGSWLKPWPSDLCSSNPRSPGWTSWMRGTTGTPSIRTQHCQSGSLMMRTSITSPRFPSARSSSTSSASGLRRLTDGQLGRLRRPGLARRNAWPRSWRSCAPPPWPSQRRQT
mmetsp:Transcript_36872/g.88055  ORF Transcript_36872/g.88055 Transcript_36872/m.88055 type:complete len:294 (-) Transcript_36872:389-1270(-)